MERMQSIGLCLILDSIFSWSPLLWLLLWPSSEVLAVEPLPLLSPHLLCPVSNKHSEYSLKQTLVEKAFWVWLRLTYPTVLGKAQSRPIVLYFPFSYIMLLMRWMMVMALLKALDKESKYAKCRILKLTWQSVGRNRALQPFQKMTLCKWYWRQSHRHEVAICLLLKNCLSEQ